MHVENSIPINRPIEEVFEYVSTPENDPTWVPVSLRNERTLPGPMRVGMTTQEDVKFLGRTSTDTWEVTEYEPPTIVAYRAASGLLSGAVVRVRCEPALGGGTRLTHAVEYEPHGIYFKALAPLLPWVMRRQLASMDRTLKNLLEGKATTSPSQTVEASTVVPLGLEETWDLLFGDQGQRAVEAIDNVISVEDFQMRADGTPQYTMVRKVGPLTMSTISDYSVFERPYRTVSRASDPDAPFGGTFYTTHEPVAGGGGTRLSFRMEVEPQNALAALMLPVIRPLFGRQLQQDLEDLAKAATTPQEGQQRQEKETTFALGVGGGVLVAGAVVFALYLLLRQRSGASRRRRGSSAR